MRFGQKGSRQLAMWLISQSIYVIEAIPGKELLGNYQGYTPEARWSLRGIKIGEAKNPGPTINCCVINATHAWNNKALLTKAEGHFIFGQEHSTAKGDHKKVRDAICGHYTKEKGKPKTELHLSNVDPEYTDRNVGVSSLSIRPTIKSFVPNPTTKR